MTACNLIGQYKKFCHLHIIHIISLFGLSQILSKLLYVQ